MNMGKEDIGGPWGLLKTWGTRENDVTWPTIHHQFLGVPRYPTDKHNWRHRIGGKTNREHREHREPCSLRIWEHVVT
jgi:hypothetical protein